MGVQVQQAVQRISSRRERGVAGQRPELQQVEWWWVYGFCFVRLQAPVPLCATLSPCDGGIHKKPKDPATRTTHGSTLCCKGGGRAERGTQRPGKEVVELLEAPSIAGCVTRRIPGSFLEFGVQLRGNIFVHRRLQFALVQPTILIVGQTPPTVAVVVFEVQFSIHDIFDNQLFNLRFVRRQTITDKALT